jgi:hypothetical protein
MGTATPSGKKDAGSSIDAGRIHRKNSGRNRMIAAGAPDGIAFT